MSVLGPELVTNGAFASATGWTEGLGWAIGGGVAVYSHNATPGDLSPTTAITVIAGRSYLVAFEVDSSAGVYSVNAKVGGTVAKNFVFSGSYSETAEAADTDNLIFDVAASAAGAFFNLDDVSVKEISVAAKIEAALFDLLILDATVSGLIGRRVYPHNIPQDTIFPAIRYTEISSPRDHCLDGAQDMVPSRWQIDCLGSSYTNARAIADAVRGVLDDYTGTVGSVVIQRVHLAEESDFYSEQPGLDQVRRRGKTMDFLIWYNQ